MIEIKVEVDVRIESEIFMKFWMKVEEYVWSGGC